MPRRMWDLKTTRDFRRKLLDWYRAHRRALPWREDPTPYRVWISEIMLQQTQTRTVLRYYDRFLRRFPDVESLAEASEPEVLELWSGLGYYSRAENLHRAARQIVTEHKSFPEEFNAILALPGIGRYTAGAICSIALNRPYPVVDGNIRRVVTRLSGVRERVPASYFWDLMSAWIPKRTPSSFNQAMMELGALVCVPFHPRCPKCPVQAFCEAKKLGVENSMVSARSGRACTRITVVTLILEHKGRILLSAMGKHDLIPGDWGLPWRLAAEPESAGETASRLCRAVFGHKIRLESCEQIRHAISNNQITVLGYYGKVDSRIPGLQEGDGLRWVRCSSAKRLLTSSLFHKVLDNCSGAEFSKKQQD